MERTKNRVGRRVATSHRYCRAEAVARIALKVVEQARDVVVIAVSLLGSRLRGRQCFCVASDSCSADSPSSRIGAMGAPAKAKGRHVRQLRIWYGLMFCKTVPSVIIAGSSHGPARFVGSICGVAGGFKLSSTTLDDWSLRCRVNE